MSLLRFNALEILYIAISIATASHTSWAAATVFEGPEPLVDSTTWWLKGLLIAIAIDVGMLITSRLIIRSQSFINTVVLIVSFGIAALGSAYMQLLYAVANTSNFVIPVTIAPEVASLIKPFIDLRVIVLPALLPLLATAYTLSQITSKEAKHDSPVLQNDSRYNKVAISEDKPLELPAPDEELKWYDESIGKWRGPYLSKKTMTAAIKSAETRRKNKGK